MMGFRVLQNGIFTTIQDQGRYGYNYLGIRESGAIDEYAYLWSQKLLGNQNANALEVMVGLKLLVISSTQIAITGADLNFKINGVLKPIWQIYYIEQGDILSFDKRVSGQRGYLAVKNGFLLEKIYGSYSTTLKDNIGSLVKKGDILNFKPTSKDIIYRVQKRYIPNYKEALILRILLSYQVDYFSSKEREKFFGSKYEITLQSDRMGYRLKGQSITPKYGGVISEGIAFGSVQIPKDGEPIVLLKERQTIGGYPKIGTVLAVDCFKLAQLDIGSKIMFKPIEIDMAEEVMREFHSILIKI